MGIEGASDWKCVWYCDIDKYAVSIYNYNFDEDYVPTDVRQLDIEKEVPKHDILCAGFPCQSFSVAGNRRGLEDVRGTLFFEICKIARVHKPKYLFLENVRGLLSINRGRDFATILNTLQMLGYREIEWCCVNSKHHGVPQNRLRVFIIGYLDGFGSRQVFPLGETVGKVQKVPRKKVREGRILHQINWNYDKKKKNREFKFSDISPTIQTSPGKQQGFVVCPTITCEGFHTYTSGMTRQTEAVANALMIRLNGQTNKLSLSDISYTVAANPDSDRRLTVLDKKFLRRLTPVECERLQGFPDDWTKYGRLNGKVVRISDTRRYRAIGNAVTVNVIRDIVKKMVAVGFGGES